VRKKLSISKRAIGKKIVVVVEEITKKEERLADYSPIR
jgi:hypothetical protein